MSFKKITLGLTTFIFFQSLVAQNFSGQWEGYITQDNLSDKFKYTINVQQRDNSIYGTSASLTMDGEHGARFELSGFWDGSTLILQELKQTMPSQPQWCIKYATLTLNEDGGIQKLSGRWKANGCTPGDMFLSRKVAMETDTLVQEIDPTLHGKWTGTLSQLDRDYGFYFEAEFTEGGEGQSYIVSEGNGGSATLLLNWSSINETRLTFEESGILKKSDGDWRWCIKSGDLNFRRDGSRLILEGSWSGYIEGYTKETGACASGRLYLEKPVMTETIIRHQKAIQKPYESESQRTVKIERVLEVSRPNIKLKVWDNGTVDGDVVTLFLNGERILNDHRVTKRKIGIPVTLQQEANFLILHAEDLGDISPNTVAVAVDDGVKEQIIILSSNLEESGAVMIRQFKVN